MGILRRLLAQPRYRRRLLGVALAWLLVVRAGLVLRSAAVLARRLGRGRGRSTARYSAQEAAWAVQAVGTRLGFNCLAKSIALHAMLRRAGFDPQVVFGVAKSPSGGILAHAWVVLDGETFLQSAATAHYEALPPLPS